MSLPLALLLLLGASPTAQSTSAADGVYTSAQASRGRTIVETHCSVCHGTDLSGLEAPALAGPSFLLKWEARNLDALFRKIRDTMPPGAAESASDDEKLDAVAYLLQQNGFPEGSAELTRDGDTLARLQMSKQTGAAALRTGTMVRVTGCLSQGPGNAWILTSATEPQISALADGQRATDAALGAQSVRLLNVFPDPLPHKGHKIEVGGLLVKDPSGDAVNVLSLEMLAAACK